MTTLGKDPEPTIELEDWDRDIEVRRAFGRYELLTRLGSGGMGNVYLARMRGPGGFAKLSAVKCIHPHLAEDRSFVEMFLDEARIAAAIDHPNVCSARDFGVIDGVYYLAMDFLAGETFSQVGAQLNALRELESLPGRGVPPPAPGERHVFVSRIVADAAEGLHAAHEAVGPDGKPLGVVHRDISLPNLFIRYDGRVEVVDFGCAKAAGSIFQTEYGKVRGHVAYMAPEILRGEPADRRSDVWSLGVALWELLSCERLFRRSSVHDSMFAVASGEIRPPSAVAPSVPPELDAIVMRALQRDRSTRYPAARQMADDLQAFVRASALPMDRPELETWMNRLFPGARERQSKLIETIAASPASMRPGSVGAPGPEGSRRLPPLEETDSLSDFTVIATRRARRRWLARFRALLASRRPGALASKRAAVAGLALLTVGLGPFVLGGPEGSSAKGTWDAATRGGADAAGTAPAWPKHDLSVGTVATEPLPPSTAGAAADTATDPGLDSTGEDGSASPSSSQAATPPTGRVNVLTPGGWAEVRLGSRRLGPTPGQFTLPAGRHELEVVRGDGTGERRVTVDVDPHRVSRVVVDGL